jgi:hypothetical protein
MSPHDRLFDHLSSPELPHGLLEHILAHIHAKERHSAIIRSVIFGLGLIASLAAFVPALQWVQSSLAESGFLDYFGLLFSDTGAILATGKSFALILLESLPVFSLALFLAIVLAFLESALHLFADASRLLALQPKKHF